MGGTDDDIEPRLDSERIRGDPEITQIRGERGHERIGGVGDSGVGRLRAGRGTGKRGAGAAASDIHVAIERIKGDASN